MSKTKLMDNKTVGMVGRFLNENAPTLLIGGAIGTLVGALFAAFKASDEVSSVKKTYDQKLDQINSKTLSEDEKAKEIKDAKSDRNVHYILAYKWVGLMGLSSILMMIGANAMNGAKIATLTTLAIANQDKLKKLAENGKKMIGEEPWKKVEDKTLEDIISENFFGEGGPKAKKIDPNKRLILDPALEVIFQVDSEEDVQEALNNAERYFKNNGNKIWLTKYAEMLGFIDIPETAKLKCWGPNNPLKAHLGTRTLYNGTLTIPSIEHENMPLLCGDAGFGIARYLKEDQAYASKAKGGKA